MFVNGYIFERDTCCFCEKVFLKSGLVGLFPLCLTLCFLLLTNFKNLDLFSDLYLFNLGKLLLQFFWIIGVCLTNPLSHWSLCRIRHVTRLF